MRGLPQPVSQWVVFSSVLPMLAPTPMSFAADQASRSSGPSAAPALRAIKPANNAATSPRVRRGLTSSRLEGAVSLVMRYLLVTVIGFIATMIMDVWGFVRQPLLGIPAADYRLVGRWVSHLARGRFQHESIAASP